MKRSNDTFFHSGPARSDSDTAPSQRTGQRTDAYTAPNPAHAGIPPAMATRTQAQLSAVWPAVPPPLRLQPAGATSRPTLQTTPTPAAASGPGAIAPAPAATTPLQPNYTPPPMLLLHARFVHAQRRGPQDDPLSNLELWKEARASIAAGMPNWQHKADSLAGRERSDFLIVSLYICAGMNGLSGYWNGAAEWTIHEIGLDTLLGQQWPAGMNLAHVFACMANPACLAALLARNGGKQLLSSRDMHGKVPLWGAVIYGRKKTARLILAHEDEMHAFRLSRMDGGCIPLHVACLNHYGSVAALLLEQRGTEQRMCADSGGRLPIHYALCRGMNSSVLPHLLAGSAPAQAFAQMIDGSNALMLAARRGSADAVRMLLDIPGSAAIQCERRNANGQRAIDLAMLMGNQEVITLIEAAMNRPPDDSSSSTANTSGLPRNARSEAPVPMTPFPDNSDTDDPSDVL